MMHKILNRLHIFDMDGTLIDSMKLWYGCETKYLDSLGIEYDKDKLITDVQGLSPLDRYHLMSKVVFNGSKSMEDINAGVVKFVQESYLKVELFEGAVEYIRRCKTKGHKIALGTTNFRNLTVETLTRLGIIDLFDVIVCNDDVSEEIGHDKTLIFDKCVLLAESSQSLTTIYEDSEYAVNDAYKNGYYNSVLHHTNKYEPVRKVPYRLVKSFVEIPVNMDQQICVERHAQQCHHMIDEYMKNDGDNFIGFKLININGITIPMNVYHNVEIYLLPGFISAVNNNKMISTEYDPDKFQAFDDIVEWIEMHQDIVQL